MANSIKSAGAIFFEAPFPVKLTETYSFESRSASPLTFLTPLHAG
jgi:hypothetical protein